MKEPLKQDLKWIDYSSLTLILPLAWQTLRTQVQSRNHVGLGPISIFQGALQTPSPLHFSPNHTYMHISGNQIPGVLGLRLMKSSWTPWADPFQNVPQWIDYTYWLEKYFFYRTMWDWSSKMVLTCYFGVIFIHIRHKMNWGLWATHNLLLVFGRNWVVLPVFVSTMGPPLIYSSEGDSRHPLHVCSHYWHPGWSRRPLNSSMLYVTQPSRDGPIYHLQVLLRLAPQRQLVLLITDHSFL